MNGWQALDQFLRTDPRDVGCEQAIEVLDVYADAVIAQGTAATELRYPASQRTCAPAAHAAKTSPACSPLSPPPRPKPETPAPTPRSLTAPLAPVTTTQSRPGPGITQRHRPDATPFRRTDRPPGIFR